MLTSAYFFSSGWLKMFMLMNKFSQTKKKRKTKRDELVMSSVGFVDTSTNTIFDTFP